MNKLTFALPAFIMCLLFIPGFVSANGGETLLTTEPVKQAVQKTEATVETVSKAVEGTEDSSEPAFSSVDPVKDAVDSVEVEEASITEPITQPVKQAVTETEKTVNKTKEKIDESLTPIVKPIKETVVEPITNPIDDSLVKPVRETVEAVKEQSNVSDSVQFIGDAVNETGEKLKESLPDPVINEEASSVTADSKQVEGNRSKTKHQAMEVEGAGIVIGTKPSPIIDVGFSFQGANRSVEGDPVARQVSESPLTEGNPLNVNKSMNGNAITVQTIQVGAPTVPVKSSSDIGMSAFLESLKLDFEAEINWSNPEEAGKSQWSHAPPGKPPKFSLLFINDKLQ